MYFNNITNIEDLKKEYHRLAHIHHPDIGGDTATMQAINAEYKKAFEKLQNIHKSADGSTYTAETEETAAEYMDIINQIISLNCDIEIIGAWVWCFNAYSCKDTLKKLGFRYASKKKAWFWHTAESSSKNRRNMTIEEIRALHGSQVVRRAARLTTAAL